MVDDATAICQAATEHVTDDTFSGGADGPRKTMDDYMSGPARSIHAACLGLLGKLPQEIDDSLFQIQGAVVTVTDPEKLFTKDRRLFAEAELMDFSGTCTVRLSQEVCLALSELASTEEFEEKHGAGVLHSIPCSRQNYFAQWNAVNCVL